MTPPVGFSVFVVEVSADICRYKHDFLLNLIFSFMMDLKFL